MTIYDVLDLFLYIAMFFDLLWKMLRLKKVKKQMPKWKRYRHHSKLKTGVILTIVIANGLYLIYRLYQWVIVGNIRFPAIAVVLPLLLYYVLFDILIGGIYYNRKAIYYKHDLIFFGEIVRSFREFDNGLYIYYITYKEKEGGEREIKVRVPNEPSAFELLGRIPFQEL